MRFITLLVLFFSISLINVTYAAKGGSKGPGDGGGGGGKKVRDTTPPVLSVPDTINVEAISSSGTSVTYTVSAADDTDANPVISCSPASASLFPVATTNVLCEASDRKGNTSSASFTVVVTAAYGSDSVDTTPPVLNVPGTMSIEATSSAGAVVNYSASATDDNDPSPVVTCTPASGSTFSLLDTTVNCQAADSKGNTSQTNFKISVLDTMAPVLSLPAPMTVDTLEGEGVVVDYEVSAADAVDTNVVIDCVPSSGEFLSIGKTQVQCSASDQYDNASSGSFLIDVVLTSNETLPTITVSWAAPTTRTDGSPLPLSELAGYDIFIVAEAAGKDVVVNISDPEVTEYIHQPEGPDVYYFSISSYDTNGVSSGLSNAVSATIP